MIAEMKMVRKTLLAGGALLMLAACHNGQFGRTGNEPAYSGTSTPPAYGETYDQGYVSPEARRDAVTNGCASGQQADFLHQDRPGGSDYDPARCRQEGR